MAASYLPIAVRAYTDRAVTDGESKPRVRGRRERGGRWPESALVVDTETTTDASQRLTFGSYRYLRLTRTGDQLCATCAEEGLFHADDLSALYPNGFTVLRRYVASYEADVAPGFSPRLKLMSRREFVDRVFYPAAWGAQATVVTFNALFDIARVAFDVRAARGRFQGGFSFTLGQYRNRQGELREDKYRPRITVKSIDSKRTMKRFTVPREVEAIGRKMDDLSDEVVLGGNLLDLRQLAYALTNEGHSLESACEAFGVRDTSGAPYVKRKVVHGKISRQYIDYNRGDVWATAELYLKVMDEFAKCVPSA